MNIWKKYQSPLGYYNNDNQIDSYGVDHSGFSTRDELNYQMARQQRENQLIKIYNSQGINKNYPQYTTNFWGNSANNNYGFGNSDIEGNVENVIKQLNYPTNNLWQKVKNVATIATDTIKHTPEALTEVMGAVSDLSRNYWDMKRDNTVGGDNYFHCKANYEAAQRGKYGTLTAQILGNQKDAIDYFINRGYKGLSYPDALADYWHDKDVNRQGRELVKNPLYSTARDACDYQRVKGINEKY